MMTFEIEIPRIEIVLENGREVIDAIGEKVAESVKQRTEAGEDYENRPLHKPLDGGQPFNRTGQFIAGIEWAGGASKKNPKGNVRVRPSRNDASSAKRTNGQIAGILAQPDKRDGSTRPEMKVLEVNDRDIAKAQAYADANLQPVIQESGKSQKIKVGK